MTNPDNDQGQFGPNSDPSFVVGNRGRFTEELEVLMSREIGPEQTLVIAQEIIGKQGDSLELANGHVARARKKLTNPAGWAPDYVGVDNLATVYVPTVGTRALVTNPEIVGANGEPKLGALNAVIRNAARLLRDSARPDHDTYESKRVKGGLSASSVQTLNAVEFAVLERAISLFKGDDEPQSADKVDGMLAKWAGCNEGIAQAFMNSVAERIAERVLPNLDVLSEEGMH